MLKDKNEIDLEIKVALLGQRQDQFQQSLDHLDQRMSRMENSISSLRTEIARWGGALGLVAASAPFLSSLING